MVRGHRTAGTPPESPRLSIVLPAHNEEHRIAPTLRAYAEHFQGAAELIVVVNGSTDQTAEVVDRIRSAFPEAIRSIVVVEAIGKGGAIQRGWREARGSVLGFVDADGATTPLEFDRLVGRLDGHDGVIASRWMRGATVYHRTSLLRKLASQGFIAVTHLLFRLPYHDTQCGAKLFRRSVVTRLLPHMRNRDMTFDVELLVLARRLGYDVIEVPTVWTDQSSSVLLGTPWRLMRTSFSMLKSLIRLALRFRAAPPA